MSTFTSQTSTASYPTLEKFQQQIQNLECLCDRLSQIINEDREKHSLLGSARNKLDLLSQSLKSQEFRVAVIGDFSQGKSTLLNALIGEEIQPTRAVPCSAVVSILTYGEEQRIICHYKDGHQEEINFQEYQNKTSLDKNLALERLSEGIVQNQVKEIIFEHPKLELCKNGVTIIDSPGLNEHPDRSSITEHILRNIDAVIFLTDAQRPLTRSEKDILEDLQKRLNINNSLNGVDNLFIVVNKWDALKKDSDRQDVRERIQNICLGKNPIILDNNRIHFLSATEALDAISSHEDNEYLQQFKIFTSSLEKFLTNERGNIKIRESSAKLDRLCIEVIDTFNQLLRQNPLCILELEKTQTEILENIAHITGHHGKLKVSAKEIEARVIKEMNLSLNDWNKNLRNVLNKCSEKWNSAYFLKQGREKLVYYHADRCKKDFDKELSEWSNSNLHDKIVKPNLIKLDELINDSITSFEFLSTSHKINGWEMPNPNWTFIGHKAIKADFSEVLSRFTWKSVGMGAGAALGYGVVAIGTLAMGISLPFIPIIGAGLIAGGLLNGNDDSEEKIKQKIIDEACEDSPTKLEEYKKYIIKNIEQIFTEELAKSDKLFARVISKCDEKLNALEEDIQKNKQEHIIWITERKQQLNELRKELSSYTQQ
jgi:GTPase Era involved in 16S rRNA processing